MTIHGMRGLTWGYIVDILAAASESYVERDFGMCFIGRLLEVI